MAIMLVTVVSLIPFLGMKESTPASEELEWYKEIVHLYVINNSGIFIVDFPFKEGLEYDPDLFSGGISGIKTILQEMIKSQQSLKIIDHEDLKLIFEYGQNFFVVLISQKDLKILRTKLKALTGEIERVFREVLADWSGNLDVFKPINTMIKNIFLKDVKKA